MWTPAARRGGSRRACAAALALLLALAAATPARAQPIVPPTDFTDEAIVGGIDLPTAIAFVPDGRLFVTELTTGHIRLVVNGAMSPVDPVVTVDSVGTLAEQGLLGIAVDPGWPARPYLYVQHDLQGRQVIRISRFTVGGDLAFTGNGALTIDPASRHDVLSDLPDQVSIHNGGTLRFGPDGMLYSSLGDDGPGCQAQDLTVLAGKILRLDVSQIPAGPGGPPPLALLTPPDNPFVAHPVPRARLVWAYGLRNPFSFHIDPANGDLFIADVGGAKWEELNWAPAAGLNFRWPLWEGPERVPTGCPGVDSSAFTAPIYAYHHDDEPGQPASVIGGPVYRRQPYVAGTFPPEYEGDVFVSDFYRGFLRRLKRSGSVWSLAPPVAGQANATDWARIPWWTSNFAQGPRDGTIWYTRYWTTYPNPNSGQIRRIRYTGVVSVPDPAAFAPAFRAPYPSPSSGPTTFEFTLAAAARVSLTLYDLRGRRVRTLVDRLGAESGPQRIRWDGRDAEGRELPAGVYLARLEAGGPGVDRRFLLLR